MWVSAYEWKYKICRTFEKLFEVACTTEHNTINNECNGVFCEH